ncbi:hypothetical protein PF005_g30764 [Phytophthora fragariae]|uniref:Uncharacterized protein n=1 Tax=Phytophthora fragariae TaxID=53985 RepID=A0A6A3V9Y9_9STRA|nr:hypothetical protein PF003_g37368 [Phytophthora fragariae]KAE8918706.1 hypothetical protein PF009_g30981 [Phytophthora fragariae]KAE8960769.1 hypothetical protein PF011_g29986 [Phytophthora fragariae]KAE9062470.1 hypothetical protein PF007_g29900 [Phytophthora fragariae]KAE9065838.1 hypothetical protein PF006_g30366 [Phytophthora fragariae]
MKGGPFGPAISTGGAAFAALGSFLANGGPPSAAHGQGCTDLLTHTHMDRVLSLKGVDITGFVPLIVILSILAKSSNGISDTITDNIADSLRKLHNHRFQLSSRNCGQVQRKLR